MKFPDSFDEAHILLLQGHSFTTTPARREQWIEALAESEEERTFVFSFYDFHFFPSLAKSERVGWNGSRALRHRLESVRRPFICHRHFHPVRDYEETDTTRSLKRTAVPGRWEVERLGEVRF